MARDIFSDALGIVIDEARPGFVKAHLTLTERHQNEHQTAHGGVIFPLPMPYSPAPAIFTAFRRLHWTPP